MKKLFLIILTALLSLQLIGCGNIKDFADTVNVSTDSDASGTHADSGSSTAPIETDTQKIQESIIQAYTFDAEKIDVVSHTNDENYGKVFTLTDIEAKKMISILNGNKWEADISKDIYDYTFEISDISIRYVSAYGLFNDPVNGRHTFVSEEERVYINSLIETLTESE